MSCVMQNSQPNWICSDVIYLHRIKYVTCQFCLPGSNFRLYHDKHFSNVTWPDYLKSAAYLLNQNSAFVIMLKWQITSCNIRKLLFNTIRIYKLQMGKVRVHEPEPITFSSINRTKCGNIYGIRFGSDTLRVQSEASAFTFNSLAQGSPHSPTASEYQPV